MFEAGPAGHDARQLVHGDRALHVAGHPVDQHRDGLIEVVARDGDQLPALGAAQRGRVHVAIGAVAAAHARDHGEILREVCARRVGQRRAR